MNFCPNCGDKINENANFCSKCGCNLGESLDIKVLRPFEFIKKHSKLDVQKILFPKRNLALNLFGSLLLLFFYIGLQNYMYDFSNKSGTILQLFLSIAILVYLFYIHYTNPRNSVWIPIILVLILAFRCYIEIRLFNEFVDWTKTQGYNTQMSVDPSASGVISAFLMVYIAFLISTLTISIKNFGNATQLKNSIEDHIS